MKMRKILLDDFEYEVPDSKIIGIVLETEEEIVFALQEERLEKLSE